jgi:hypothetical protein
MKTAQEPHFYLKIVLAYVLNFTNQFFIGYWILLSGLDFYPVLFFALR